MFVAFVTLALHAAAPSTVGDRSEFMSMVEEEVTFPASGFQCAEASSKFDCALNFMFLDTGYFQLVEDPAELTAASREMQTTLRELGIPAEVGACDWMGLVAVGTANGNISYGAMCDVRMGQRPPRRFMICNSRYGGITLVEFDVYPADAESIEMFIRRSCF